MKLPCMISKNNVVKYDINNSWLLRRFVIVPCAWIVSMRRFMSYFKDNIDALKSRYPELAKQVSLSTLLESVGVAQAADGLPVYLRKEEGKAVGALTDHQRPLQRLNAEIGKISKKLADFSTPVLVVGFHPGVELLHIFENRERLTRNECEQPIWVCIDSLETFHGFLQAYDAREVLASPRVRFFLAEEMPAQVQWLQEHPEFSYLFTLFSLSPTERINRIMQPLVKLFQERATLFERYKSESEAYYGALDDSSLGEILSGRAGRKPRLLVPSCPWSTVVQYSVRDACKAFERAGWETRIITAPTMMTSFYVAQLIHEFKPDIYLYINHLRTETLGVVPEELMMVSWIQDTLPYVNDHDVATKWNEVASQRKRDLIVGYIGQLKPYGYLEDRLVELNMIVDTEVFRPRELTPEQIEKYGCDVCFASNAGLPTERRVKERLVPLFDELGLAEATLMDYHDRLWEHYRAEQTITTYQQLIDFLSLDATPEDEVVQLLFWRLNDVIYRHVVLEWLDDYAQAHPDFKINLYGNEWDQHPRFAKYARGPIEHGEELSIAYQAAKRCLHLNSVEGVHQRVFEVVVSGAHLLTRYRDESVYGSSAWKSLLRRMQRCVSRFEVEDELSPEVCRVFSDYVFTSLNRENAVGQDWQGASVDVLKQLHRICQLRASWRFKSWSNHHFSGCEDLVELLDVQPQNCGEDRDFFVMTLNQSVVDSVEERISHFLGHWSDPVLDTALNREVSKIFLFRNALQGSSIEHLRDSHRKILYPGPAIQLAYLRALRAEGQSDDEQERLLVDSLPVERLNSQQLLVKAKMVALVDGMDEAYSLLEKSRDELGGRGYELSEIAWLSFVARDFSYDRALPYLTLDWDAGVLSGEGQLNYAQALAACGKIDKARNIVADAYSSQLSLVNGYARCGYSAFSVIHFDPLQAVEWMKADDEMARLQGMFRTHYASALALAGDLECALEVVERAYLTDPGCFNGYAVVGWLHCVASGGRDVDVVTELYEQDRSLGRLKFNANNFPAAIEAFIGNRERAERMIAENYGTDLRIAGGYTMMGFADYSRSHDLGFLADMMSRDRQLGRSFSPPWFDYLHGTVLLKTGHVDQAMKLIESSIERSSLTPFCARSWLESSCIGGGELVEEICTEGFLKLGSEYAAE